MRDTGDMLPATKLPRPALLALLALLGLGGGLTVHLWQTRQAVRTVSPLPLAAPGFTLEAPEGADMRVVPLAGSRLRSMAAPDPDGERPRHPAQSAREARQTP